MIPSPAAPPRARRPLVERPRFRADIEGLRAVAVVLVVGYHAGVPWLGGGYVGVDVFFVLSGYLITWLLVHEAEETGAVRLARFYGRRARRLLPALAVVLGATALAGALVYAPFEQRDLAKTTLATALYLSNVLFARRSTDYFGAGVETDPLLHTWSLSVEEQFYLAWPLFVMAALGVLGGRRRVGRRRLVGWLAAGGAVSFALSLGLTDVRQPWAFFLAPARAWEFAVGALALLLPTLGRGFPTRRLNPDAARAGVGLLGMGAIVGAAVGFGPTTPFPGVAAVLPVVGTALVLRAGTAEARTPTARLLGLRPLQVLGRLSYGWYLWHWPALVIGAALGVASAPGRLALVVGSLGLAALSYRLVETPLRYSASLSGRPGRSLALAAGLTVLGAGLGIGWGAMADRWASSPGQEQFARVRADLPAVAASGCHAPFLQTDAEAERCAEGPADALFTVVLFGDSHAAQWHPALAAAVAARGGRLVNLTKASCPAVDVETFSPALGRPYRECTAWRADAVREIRSLRPDLVVVSSSTDYGVAPADWEAGTVRQLAPIAAAGGRVAVLLDTPRPPLDVAACLARAAWRPGWLPRPACTFEPRPSADVAAALVAAAGRLERVEAVDLGAAVCPEAPCAPERDGHVVFRDDQHLTASFAASLAETLAGGLRLPPVPPTVPARQNR